MPPLEKVISSSPSNVPAVSKVPAGKSVITFPFVPSDTVHVSVDLTVVLPNSLRRNLTEAPVTSIGAQVVLSLLSSVLPDAAVWLSLSVKVSSGSVSPVTNFKVCKYAISSTYRFVDYISLANKCIPLITPEDRSGLSDIHMDEAFGHAHASEAELKRLLNE